MTHAWVLSYVTAGLAFGAVVRVPSRVQMAIENSQSCNGTHSVVLSHSCSTSPQTLETLTTNDLVSGKRNDHV